MFIFLSNKFNTLHIQIKQFHHKNIIAIFFHWLDFNFHCGVGFALALLKIEIAIQWRGIGYPH